jgi:hypothetical protein
LTRLEPDIGKNYRYYEKDETPDGTAFLKTALPFPRFICPKYFRRKDPY